MQWRASYLNISLHLKTYCFTYNYLQLSGKNQQRDKIKRGKTSSQLQHDTQRPEN